MIFKLFIKISFGIVFITAISFVMVWYFLRPVSKSEEPVTFIIPENTTGFDIGENLFKEKLIRNKTVFSYLYTIFSKNKPVKSGGYLLDRSMNLLTIAQKLSANPDLLWFTISGCRRREEIGEMLAKKFGWDEIKLTEWNSLYTEGESEYREGVYYPDTYLLPVGESPKQFADRLIGKFNEKFSVISGEFMSKNIKWTTGLKIASLIQREAAGVNDMPIVSAVIWNRLDEDMRLQIDATMQYTRGKKPDGSWWGQVDLREKSSDSPFNTYLYKGLPPRPICSPNIEAIKAVINPSDTDCLFYLHDKNKEIHCAVTYEEHKSNIGKYLK